MRLLSLKAINFRNFTNLDNFKIDESIRDIYLVGNNGQGKTNLLEAIYYVCFGSSFRTNYNKRLIQNNKKEAYLFSEITDDDNQKRTISVKLFENKGKEIRIDSKTVNDRKILIQNTACIVFTHEDMVFINGSPDKKRWFINQTTSLVNNKFIDLLINYSKILKNRNMALKHKQYDVFDLYDDRLIDYGILIKQKRLNIVKEFNKTLKAIFSAIVGENDIELIYKPSWVTDSKNDIERELNKSKDRDKLFGNTFTGPHRDIFEFIVSGKNFVHFASTGQIRLLAIILRIAQLQFVTHSTNKKHIILVDDVLLELDQDKKKSILKQINDYEQAFFTFLPDTTLIDSGRSSAVTFSVLNGNVEIWKKQAI